MRSTTELPYRGFVPGSYCWVTELGPRRRKFLATEKINHRWMGMGEDCGNWIFGVCNAVCTRRSSKTMLVGRTPASNTTGEQLLVVVKAGTWTDFGNTNKHFVYRQNSNVADIFPLSHLLRYAYTHLSRNNAVRISLTQNTVVKLERWRLTCQFPSWWSPDLAQFWQRHLRLEHRATQNGATSFLTIIWLLKYLQLFNYLKCLN